MLEVWTRESSMGDSTILVVTLAYVLNNKQTQNNKKKTKRPFSSNLPTQSSVSPTQNKQKKLWPLKRKIFVMSKVWVFRIWNITSSMQTFLLSSAIVIALSALMESVLNQDTTNVSKAVFIHLFPSWIWKLETGKTLSTTDRLMDRRNVILQCFL